VRQNVERWINQFDAAGRKAKVTHGEAARGKYVLVDVSGTYQQPIGPPRQQRTERLEDARMLAVILQVKDQDVYYLKLAGPEETVSASAEHLRRAFGGDAEKEQPLDLDEGE
jgi:gluconolactonase